MAYFPKINEYYSFDTYISGESYELKELEQDVINKFKNLIYKLEKIPQVTLCTRGDSKKSLEEHNNFFDKELSKFFIVGEKAQSNYEESIDDKYKHTYSKKIDIDFLILELANLIYEVNNEIKNKPKKHNISGTIDIGKFIDEICKKSDFDILEKWKIFFLSFLHNSGSLKRFKSNSPFLSMAHGYRKYKIAREFAFNRISHDKAIIYLGSRLV